MDYLSLLKKLENYKEKYVVKSLGKTAFNREIFAVEKIVNENFYTAIFVASTHARENITTDLVCKMLDENLFDEIVDFNICFILMHNPDGVELCLHGLASAPESAHEKLTSINGNSLDFSLWKANGEGVDLNNNFDANFGEHIHSNLPAPQGYIGEFPNSAAETKILVDYISSLKLFLLITYHSKGEEIYYNFFQQGKLLERDTIIAKRFESSTGYTIKNVENVSSGGLKDYCVKWLKIPSLTIEVGNDNLSHPITKEYLDSIFSAHKNVAKDLNFAYNVFNLFL